MTPIRGGRGCPLCGFRGGVRDGGGRCVDVGTCAHRRMLEMKGRPRESSCYCANWPCACKCHADEHDPPVDEPRPTATIPPKR